MEFVEVVINKADIRLNICIRITLNFGIRIRIWKFCQKFDYPHSFFEKKIQIFRPKFSIIRIQNICHFSICIRICLAEYLFYESNTEYEYMRIMNINPKPNLCYYRFCSPSVFTQSRIFISEISFILVSVF